VWRRRYCDDEARPRPLLTLPDTVPIDSRDMMVRENIEMIEIESRRGFLQSQRTAARGHSGGDATERTCAK